MSQLVGDAGVLHVTAYPGSVSAPPVLFVRGLPARPAFAGPGTQMFERFLFRGVERTHRVFAVGRPVTIPAGSDMAAIAGVFARAIFLRFGRPIAVVGMSTGASIALQLALDHPEAVERLAVLAGAGRLSDRGRTLQSRYAELLVAGVPAAAVRFALGTLGVPFAVPVPSTRAVPSPPRLDAETEGLVALLRAEDRFDVLTRTDSVAVPSLFVSGGRDIFYPAPLAAETVQGMRQAEHLVLPRLGHAAVGVDPRARSALVRFLSAGS